MADLSVSYQFVRKPMTSQITEDMSVSGVTTYDRANRYNAGRRGLKFDDDLIVTTVGSKGKGQNEPGRRRQKRSTPVSG